MKSNQLVFLKLLETELVRTLIPAASNDIARRIATLAADQLYRVRLDETVVPQLRGDAVAAYRTLLPSLSSYIDQALCTRLDQTLSAANADAVEALDSVLRSK